jgi:hypothetical protein
MPALQAAEKLCRVVGLVSGHDFSRADKADKMNRASAPAVCLYVSGARIQAFFRSLFIRAKTELN